MAKTTSLSFPTMINVAQNQVAVLEDEAAVVNRVKCLFLTEPTEVYNEPNQGVGLKRYLWQYNSAVTEDIIKKKMVDQLRLHEPQCNADDTQFASGNIFTGSEDDMTQKYNKLEMTVAIKTIFGAEYSEISLDF